MKTIIAAFSDQNAANAATAYLQNQQLQNISVLEPGDNSVARLRELDIPDDRAHAYAELMRRGAVIVTAQTEAHAHDIARELDRFGSLDVEAARDRWRKQGWNAYDEKAQPFDAEASATERSELVRESGFVAGTELPATPEREIDVVEEQVAVGKREVPRGGVRVRTFIAERPVREDVQLREERIDVTREAVNEPISASPLEGTVGEEEFEITARGEEVVVGKEARVVERVHVGKTADTRTERVEETERRRDVEVEPIETTEARPEPVETTEPRPTRH